MTRAGSGTAYYWGNEIGAGNANCDGCGGSWQKELAPVGSFKPNAFGLYDVHGNVWEWVEDCYQKGRSEHPDGRAVESPGDCFRVFRGGSWIDRPDELRAARREYLQPHINRSIIGFRLARTL